MILAFLLLALTRAEIVERMRAPVVTQADGMVRVFANCPEDMRREFQGPVASFAATTLERLYRGERMRPVAFESPAIIIHLGDVRTNVTAVTARVATNESRVVTRIYVPSPGFADLEALRTELVKGFYRAVRARECSDAEAYAAYVRADPDARRRLSRERIESFLRGDRAAKGAGVDDEAWDEEHLALMRKVLEVGVATRRDVATFASRLFLRPPFFSEPFRAGARSLSFREAVAERGRDGRLAPLARQKAVEVALYGGGRSAELGVAAQAFVVFLDAFASGADDEDLVAKLTLAENLLKHAWETAK